MGRVIVKNNNFRPKFFFNFFDLGVDFFENSCILISVMRETLKENKKLVCQECGREDGAKSDWEGFISVLEWGNEHDFGTICDECQEDQIDSL